jgi:hypothetical protein
LEKHVVTAISSVNVEAVSALKVDKKYHGIILPARAMRNRQRILWVDGGELQNQTP